VGYITLFVGLCACMRQRVSIVANLKNTFLAQIDLVLAQFEEIAKKTKYRDFSDISYGMYTRLRAAERKASNIWKCRSKQRKRNATALCLLTCGNLPGA
jgi:hypothetical protein